MSLAFSNKTLTATPSLPYSFVEDAYYMFFTSIHLYGLTYCPSQVLVEWTELRPVVCQGSRLELGDIKVRLDEFAAADRRSGRR